MTTASPELIVSLRQMTHHGCSIPSNAGRRVSLFEPHTQIIRKGKAGKRNEFGKLAQLQEAENQIIMHYEVYDERPSDQHLPLPAVEV